jgi:hypothetical protein
MKIGVAIPCTSKHKLLVLKLLDSINKQTKLPDEVVISFSSAEEKDSELFKTEYKFKLSVYFTKTKKNAAENRNIAASFLQNMDIISFIDADDCMSIHRIEYLYDVFEKYNCDIVVHNFIGNNSDTHMNVDEKPDKPEVRINMLKSNRYMCGLQHIDNASFDIHHAHVSVKKDIFDKVKFPEAKESNQREDSQFCSKVLSLENITSGYIKNPLSIYNSKFSAW